MDSRTPLEQELARSYEQRLADARRNESNTPADDNATALARRGFVEQHRRLTNLTNGHAASRRVYVTFADGTEPIPLTNFCHILVVVDSPEGERLFEIGGPKHPETPPSPGSSHLELGAGVTVSIHVNPKPNLG